MMLKRWMPIAFFFTLITGCQLLVSTQGGSSKSERSLAPAKPVSSTRADGVQTAASEEVPAECSQPTAEFRSCDRCPDRKDCEERRSQALHQTLIQGKKQIAKETMALQRGKPVALRVIPSKCYTVVIEMGDATLLQNALFEGQIKTDVSANHPIRNRKGGLWTSDEDYCAKAKGELKVIAWTGKEWSPDGRTMLQAENAGTGEATVTFYERGMSKEDGNKTVRAISYEDLKDFDRCQERCSIEQGECISVYDSSVCEPRKNKCLKACDEKYYREEKK